MPPAELPQVVKGEAGKWSLGLRHCGGRGLSDLSPCVPGRQWFEGLYAEVGRLGGRRVRRFEGNSLNPMGGRQALSRHQRV